MLERVHIVRAVSCEISRILGSLERIPDSNSIFQIFAHSRFSRLRPLCNSPRLVKTRRCPCDLFRSLFIQILRSPRPERSSDKTYPRMLRNRDSKATRSTTSRPGPHPFHDKYTYIDINILNYVHETFRPAFAYATSIFFPSKPMT